MKSIVAPASPCRAFHGNMCLGGRHSPFQRMNMKKLSEQNDDDHQMLA
jgi:hypothetical protein